MENGEAWVSIAEESVTSRLLSVDQHQIPQVDEGARSLSDNEHRVVAMDGICQHDQAAGQTHVPKCHGNLTLRFPFGCDPLNQPTGEEQALPEKADTQPDAFRRRQVGEVGADTGKKFAHGSRQGGKRCEEFVSCTRVVEWNDGLAEEQFNTVVLTWPGRSSNLQTRFPQVIFRLHTDPHLCTGSKCGLEGDGKSR